MNIKELIDNSFEDYKNDLKSLVAVESVLDENGVKPFGAPIQQALEEIIAISKRMGFKTYIDPEGYYGYAEIGEGEELFGVLGHIDVVPVGDINEWHTHPFELVEKDGKLFGRGSSDDKGPTLASMYALKILLEQGKELDKRVRFIFGTDEESLWRCMKAYTAKEEIPTMGFTPDSSFPLTYAEKGLIEYFLTSHELSDIRLEGGGPLNAVPSQAFIDVDEDVIKELEAMNVRYEVKADDLIVYGKAMHAMAADQGENAIVYAAQALHKVGKRNRMIDFIVDVLADPNGKGIYGPVEDEVSGKLMLNVGKVEFDGNSQKVGIDMRFPVTFSRDKVDEGLKKISHQYRVVVELYDELPSIYVERESELIQGLMKAYQNVTGDLASEPIVSGGATYARAMKNVVAFGAGFPGTEKTEHQANEYIVIEDIKKAMEVYIEAFMHLVVR
ncbi:Sapep family Mn(2+)-dependent dipeptidase [Erysipelothrix urinaevulpis]|uniref:Sapep family Mn(2+)-dependent dipeptidase n=1 Tax=Erysipelothrix urinaevulpis TaxID=2683717 RepID=UPI00135B97D4|nr:Sapep family Mn(2+)-dependent dipeptidase [Erysipelothrix urinaevulpis]